MAAYTGVFKTWSNFYNGSYLFSYFLSHINYFCKKAPYRCSAGFEIGFCIRVWNIELTLVPSLQIKPKKYSARKHVWHRFWKGERSWWDSTQNECLEKKPSERLFQKGVTRNFAKFTRKHLCRNLFFLWSFLVNFETFLRTPFWQNSTGRLLLIIAALIVTKVVLGNETTKKYDTKN